MNVSPTRLGAAIAEIVHTLDDEMETPDIDRIVLRVLEELHARYLPKEEFREILKSYKRESKKLAKESKQ